MAGVVLPVSHCDSVSIADSAASVGAPSVASPSAASEERNEWRATVKSHGLLVSFQDVGYSVRRKTQKLTILKHVTGYFEPGHMTAVMGPSGSGKTTFLDALAGRKTAGQLTGKVKFGGLRPTPSLLRRATGYVEQFDTLVGALTVSEMLMYTAQLKRPIKEGQAAKREAVAALIDKLALGICSNTRIGSAENRHISGGQAKRVNIGMALITDPRVLFLDEPTSGLDSYTSNEVMTVVKGLTKDGTTVAATIHSPSSTCYSLFDKVLVLLGGRVVYFGCPSRQAISFFTRVWSARSPVLGDNLAEWMLDLVVEADRKGQAAEAAALYESSELCKDAQVQLNNLLTAATSQLQSSPSTLAELQAAEQLGDSLFNSTLYNVQNVPPGLKDGISSSSNNGLARTSGNSSSSGDGSFSPSHVGRNGTPRKRQSHDSACVRRSMHPVAVGQPGAKEVPHSGLTVGSPMHGSRWKLGTSSSSGGKRVGQLLSRCFVGRGSQAATPTSISSGSSLGAHSNGSSSSRWRFWRTLWEGRGQTSYTVPSWWAFAILFRYRTLTNYSTFEYYASHVMDKLVFSLLLMSLFWGIGSNFGAVNVPTQCSVLFLLVGGPAWGAVGYVPNIVGDRTLFIRERNDGLYRPIVYLAHKVVEELLLIAPLLAGTSAIVWYGVKLQGSFLLFWLISYATLANGIAIAYFLAVMSPSMAVATSAVPTALAASLLFCGLLIRRGSTPPYYLWVVDANPFSYAWAAFMVNQYDQNRNALLGPMRVLTYYGLDKVDPWRNVGIMWGCFGVIMCATWAALAYRRYGRR